MKKYIIILTLLFAVSQEGRALESNEPSLQVLIAKDIKGALLEAKGGYKIESRESHKLLSYGSTGKRFVTHALSNGLRWGEEFPGIYAISVFPTHPDTTFFVNGMQYQGAIHVYNTKKGLISIVNEVPIESFVLSTLSLKVTSPMNSEGVAALAIAERTNAFARGFFRKEGKSLWDVEAHEVNYLGMGVTMQKNGVSEAIASTRSIVLEDRAGIPMQNVDLSVSDAEKLAARGLDAKKILRQSVARGEIGMMSASKKETKERS